MIDKKEFEANWQGIRGKSREWWSLINDIDLGRLDKSPDKLKKYVMLLQVKYGYSSEFAGKEINRHVEEHQAEEKKVPAMEPGKPAIPTPGHRTRKS